MKKLTIITAFAIASFAASAQRNFIGKNIDTVYNYYSKAVGSDFLYRDKGVLKVFDGGTPLLTVAAFDFDTTGTCTYQQFYVQKPDKPKYDKALQQNKKLQYNASTKKFTDKTNNTYWYWSSDDSGTIWYLHCKKSK